MSEHRVPLAGGVIDRDAGTRASADSLASAWAEPGATVLLVYGSSVPVHVGDGSLVLVPTADVTVPAAERIYLGRREGVPVFAAAVESERPQTGVSWTHTFAAALRFDDAERELVTMALAVVRWHEAATYSPRDGAATTVEGGGWSRRTEHGAELFPRTDPAVIVLITHEDRVLLGSNVLWETGRFSLLAGFIEAGETAEGAVAREVFEESGMRVGAIRYVASQPWPFPRSLMLGFRAELDPAQDPGALVADPAEITELRWFSRAEILAPGADLKLPGQLSIAGWLLDSWARETAA